MQKITHKFTTLFAVLLTLSITIACSSDDNDKPSTGLKFSNTNYADLNNWLFFNTDSTKDVDIFVLYPTMAGVPVEDGMPFVNLNSAVMRERAT